MSLLTFPRTRPTLVAIALVAVLGSAANAAVALGAILLSASPGSMPLQPVAYLTLTVLAAIVGAFGWRLIRTRSARPARTLRRVVPAALLLSFVPDILMGVTLAWPWPVVIVAMLMHLITAAIAVCAYASWMPVRRV